MIFRDSTDLAIAIGVACAAAGTFLFAFLFWWPLFVYALSYWGL